MWVTRAAKHASRGETRARAVSLPPHMALSRPSAAASAPPLTGQSISSTPRAAACAAQLWMTAGRDELVSTTAVPRRQRRTASVSVSCTSALPGRLRNTTSLFSSSAAPSGSGMPPWTRTRP